MKPCFGYIRVSTTRQGDGASLDAQRDAIAGFASQHGLTVTKWFEEQETAAKTGRPIFDAMLRELRKGDAAGLIIHRIDRSSRNYADWARLDEASRAGIKIYFAADSLDFDSRGGRLLADIQMALAADYSRNLSLEVKKGQRGRLKQGQYPFRAPIGYLNPQSAKKPIDPIKGPLVRQAFELYCAGEYSITSLTKEMQRRGLTGYAGQPVVRRNIETMLRNPFYMGKILLKGVLYDGTHEPLISARQFQRVKEIKAQRTQKKSTKHGMRYRGLVHCGHCGRVLTGEHQKAHCYYRCHTKGCPTLSIREDILTTALVRRLKRLSIATEDVAEAEAHFDAWLCNHDATPNEQSLQLRKADAQARQERLTDLLVDGAITKADYDLRRQNSTFELAQLEEELRRLRDLERSRHDLKELVHLAADLSTTFLAGTVPEQRRLLRNCFAKIELTGQRLQVKPADWLGELRRVERHTTASPSPALLDQIARS
jgi:DNA invertase Pin-like site-specific DNA recombinase